MTNLAYLIPRHLIFCHFARSPRPLPQARGAGEGEGEPTDAKRITSFVFVAALTILAASTLIAPVGLAWCSNAKYNPPEAPKEYKTKTGITIIIAETHPVGRSLSTIEIRTKGFEHSYAEIYEDRDPISNVFVADLDGNGFDEIYIITTSVGSGSYGTVLAFASNKDKSLSMINFPERQEGDENFEGYMGHDTFKIEHQKLVRIFPIYNMGDTNENPTGGRRKLVYGLYPGEAMWQLKIEKSENLNIP